MLGLPETIPGLAGGDIRPCRFIEQQIGVNNSFIECNANGIPAGISQSGPKGNQIVGSTTLCAEDGDQFGYFAPGCANVMLEIASAVEAGDRLVPDADGKGIPASHATGTVTIGAMAQQNGVAGDFIPVRVTVYQLAFLNNSSGGSG